MKLYEITTEFQQLVQMLDAADGEVDDAFDARLRQLEGELSAKVEGCLTVARAFELEAEALDVEIERLEARRKVRTNKVERLREYVRTCLMSAGIPSVSTKHFTARIQAGQQKVVVTNFDALLAYDAGAGVLIRTKHEPKMSEIKQLVAMNQTPPGVEVQPGTPFLVVR